MNIEVMNGDNQDIFKTLAAPAQLNCAPDVCNPEDGDATCYPSDGCMPD